MEESPRNSRAALRSIEREFERYRKLGLSVFDQLSDGELSFRPSESSNSVAQLVWHISGNFRSRFTDFLESDGEKPWREREAEFEPRDPSPDDLVAQWDGGWRVLMEALVPLRDVDLKRTVVIRGRELTVHAALLRSLAHLSYHVGQMVYIGKQLRGSDWQYQSIAPGQTDAFNRSLARE